MKKTWFYLYNIIVIPVLYLAVHILSLFNHKIKSGIKGRVTVFEDLITNTGLLNKSRKLIWFHSSSMGEFEQAKPIIEEIKKTLT